VPFEDYQPDLGWIHEKVDQQRDVTKALVNLIENTSAAAVVLAL
jgi:hypothetical protein